MKKLHEKFARRSGGSPCCRGEVRKFGKRRRQCTICLKTWRVWKKKLGRRRSRNSLDLLFNYLDNSIGALSKYAPKRKLTPAALTYELRKSRDVFVKKTSWPDIPSGNLIAVADAMMQTAYGEIYTFYFILLRAIDGKEAVITPPLLLLGKESRIGWQKTFGKLPKEVRRRIFALVCDGHRGLVDIAKDRELVLQRCHFHLRHSLANYIRTGPMSKNREVGLEIQKLVDIMLLEPDEKTVEKAFGDLVGFQIIASSKGVRRVLSGFLKCYGDFRSYLYYPAMNLPITSNSMESLINCIRSLQCKARGFRRIKSLDKWIAAICKHKKRIACNGRNYQPN